MVINGSEKGAGNADVQDGIQEKPLQDSEAGESYDLSVSKDGVKLHPQPTSDPLDPLNWSSFKKHTILAIVMFK